MQIPLIPIVILERLLEILIGVIAILNFRIRFFGGNGLSQKELLKRIEEQDRKIVKLQMEKRQLKACHDYRNVTAKRKYARNYKQPLALS